MQNLFVFGCPRSGTTALGAILNAHPLICLGIERYRHIAMGALVREFLPSLFTPERFCQMDEQEPKRAANQFLLKKFESGRPLAFIGDKIPRLYARLDVLEREFPEASIIYIFRDPLEVAHSWQKRADNPQDSWPSTNGRVAAIAEWTKSIDAMVEALPRWKARATIIDYATFFNVSTPEALGTNIARLYKRLGLGMRPENMEKVVKRFWRQEPNLPSLSDDPTLAAMVEQARKIPGLDVLRAAAL